MDSKDYAAGSKETGSWFTAKKELLAMFLKKMPNKRLKILNLGAGTGGDLEILNRFGEVYVIDIDEKAISMIPDSLCKKKELGDARNLKYPDNFFDIVVSLDVFEHIDNDAKAINETWRVLKKSGYLIFSVPAFQALYSSHDKALEHQRRYSKKRIVHLIKKFRKKRITFWNTFLFLPLALIRIKNKKSMPKPDSFNLPKSIDQIPLTLLRIENYLISIGLSLPFGMSIAGICQK
jgi:ubiquinone/menaquinone biosynthesis C-methylase UbiE